MTLVQRKSVLGSLGNKGIPVFELPDGWLLLARSSHCTSLYLFEGDGLCAEATLHEAVAEVKCTPGMIQLNKGFPLVGKTVLGLQERLEMRHYAFLLQLLL